MLAAPSRSISLLSHFPAVGIPPIILETRMRMYLGGDKVDRDYIAGCESGIKYGNICDPQRSIFGVVGEN